MDLVLPLQEHMYAALFKNDKLSVLLRAGIMIVVISLLDWWVVGEIPLGFLYLVPMLTVGVALNPWEIGVIAALCTLMAEVFDDLAWTWRTGLSRDVLYFAAFCWSVRTVSLNRRSTLNRVHEIERQSDARREAEEQLRILIESSPAAILTTAADGTVLMANEAAHRLLSIPQGQLQGRLIYRYLPSLTNVFQA